jgi:hypothetical protein
VGKKINGGYFWPRNDLNNWNEKKYESDILSQKFYVKSPQMNFFPSLFRQPKKGQRMKNDFLKG